MERKYCCLKCLYGIIFFSFLVGSVRANNSSIYPRERITIANGLAHNGVTSLLQDKFGYYWIGTYDGLNRYDGAGFKTYRNTSERSYLLSNRIRTLEEDDEGRIWIGTDEGIAIYDQEKQLFSTLYSHQNNSNHHKGPIIRDLLVDKNNKRIIAATEEFGVLLFDADLSFLGEFTPDNLKDIDGFIIYNVVKYHDDKYLIATTEGVYTFHGSSGEFVKISLPLIDAATYILQLSEGRFAITTSTGVRVIENRKENWELVASFLASENFNCVEIDKRGRMWLGTVNQGIRRVDNLQEVLEGEEPAVVSEEGEQGFIRTSGIYNTKNNGIWVTTFNHGLLRFDLYPNSFHQVPRQHNSVERLHTNEVPNIAPLSPNSAFMTAHHGGKILFDFSQQQFRELPATMPASIQDDITGVYSDEHGAVWFKNRNNEITVLRADGTYDPAPVIEEMPRGLRLVTMCEDGDGNIWVANTKDFYRLQLDGERKIKAVHKVTDHSFFKSKPIYKIRTLYYDSVYDYMWVGTDTDGLFRMKLGTSEDLDSVQVDQFVSDPSDLLSLPSNFVSAIVRLPNGELFLGTERGGICKVRNSEKDSVQFINYSEKNGLSNNVVKNILYDDDYNLWISTNIGLNRFDPKSQNFRVYKRSDGLPFEDFSYAAEKMSDGTMVFSGIKGICYFHPDDLSDEEPVPLFQFDNLTISGRSILPGDSLNGRVLLEKSLSSTDRIDLEYDENVFSIDVNALHYGSPENHYIKYQLKPINDQWIQVKSHQKTIHFSGLQPGEYTLHTMVSNSLNEWGNPRTITIVIHPPFWKTPIAYLIYSLLLGLVILGIIYIIIRFQKLHHNIEIHRLEKETEVKLNNAKLRFFSNISHEIKTPLTLLQGPIEFLSHRFKYDIDVVDKLNLVQRQAHKISLLVDQVHDFQRAEANVLKMHLDQFNFDHFLLKIYQDYHFITEQGDKKIQVIGGDDPINVKADTDKLEKVINNLLSNAIKFTNKGDTITIKYHKEGENLAVSVSDTGTGIPDVDQSSVFDRFFQSTYNNSSTIGGSGIGLAFTKRLVEMHYGRIWLESKIGEGTTFYITLPIIDDSVSDINDRHYHQSEFLKSEMEAETTNRSTVFDSSPTPFSTSYEGATLFVVEDNTEMQQYLEGFLGQQFNVKCFNDGKECLDALEHEWPDIVISDVMMPNVNGFELTHQIKSNIKTSHVPVLLLTASQADHDKLRGYEGGADAYLKKPFERQHLLVRIESLLLSRHQIRKRFEIDLPLTITKEESNDHAFLDKLYFLIDQNLDNQDLDLDSFSRELYLNRTHFYQKVKAITGQTPYELLKNYRLKKAAQILYEGKHTVNEVYMMTGFKSRTHFAKIFKEKYGSTPGKYAQKIEETIK
ncbi:hybrid sensor histidine kinase/response regulator transcription factor [Echinicola strongylocentroti]|nr:hybrid sensor histidine kinase/response regulator transcription factor [Echinicola strongylocentroti]